MTLIDKFNYCFIFLFFFCMTMNCFGSKIEGMSMWASRGLKLGVTLHTMITIVISGH